MRRLAAVLIAFLFVGTDARAQSPDTLPPVLLAHGWQANSALWDWMDPELRFAGFSRVFRTSTSFTSPIATQSVQLNAFATSAGISAESPILVAHSMGGLVARELNTTLPADAVITFGSPHQGQLLLKAGWGSSQLWLLAAGISVPVGEAFFNLIHCGNLRADINGNDIEGPCYDLWDFLAFTGLLTAGTLAIRNNIIQDGATDDMTPSSPFLMALNGSSHVAAEAATTKVAIIGRLNSWEWGSSFFRNFFGESESAYYADYLEWFAAASLLDGAIILADADPDDPWYWERVAGGAGVVAAGLAVQYFPAAWNNMVGWPNDAFVNTSTQVFPGSLQVDFPGVAHMEEPQDPFVRNQILNVGLLHKR